MPAKECRSQGLLRSLWVAWLVLAAFPIVGARATNYNGIVVKPVPPAEMLPPPPSKGGAPKDRPLSVDFGAGFPTLLAAGAQIRVRPWLQIGASYGILPTEINATPDFNVNPVAITLANGTQYSLAASRTQAISLNMLHPYVRIFPFPDRDQFYVQLAYSLLRFSASVDTDLVADSETLGKALTFKLSFTQPLPTISVGHLFLGNVYFANVSIGASFIGNATAEVETTTALPDSVGGFIANQDAVVKARAEITDAASRISDELRRQVFIIPSLALSFGILF